MWGRFPSGSLQGSVLYLFIFLDDVAAKPKAHAHAHAQPRMKKYNHIWPAFAVCIFVPREQG